MGGGSGGQQAQKEREQVWGPGCGVGGGVLYSESVEEQQVAAGR